MASRGRRPRRLSAAVIAGLLGGVLAPAAIGLALPMADSEQSGRISDITTEPGTIAFDFAVVGLSPDQSIDPSTVSVTIDGERAMATAAFASSDAARSAPVRQSLLVLDTSGSMAEDKRMAAAKKAAQGYLDSVPDDVEVGLVTFADSAEVAVSPTADREEVARAIKKLEPEGSTALYDATVLAVKTLGPSGSRSIVLLSDGKDEGSRATLAKAAKKVSESGVTLDAVAIGAGEQRNQLAALAEAGNGSLVTATSAKALAEAFAAAARTVSNQLGIKAEVPASVTAGTRSLTATVMVSGTPVSDTTVAEIVPRPAAAAEYGARTVTPPSGLITQPWLVPAGIGVLFLGLLTVGLLAVNTIDPSHRKDGRIARRLQDALPEQGPTVAVAAGSHASPLGEGAVVRGAVQIAGKIVQEEPSDKLELLLLAAGIPLKPAEWVVVHSLIAMLSALFAALMTGVSPLWTLVGLALGALVPWLVLKMKVNRRRSRFYDQLPDTMQLLSGSLAAGYSLPQALDTVARESVPPMNQEVNRALLEARLGVPIEQSLEAIARRMASTDFHWVVLAINMNRQVGGNLADVLRTVGATLRERERLRRQVKALSAEGRLSALVLGILPFAMAAYMLAVRPEFISLLWTEPLGLVMLAFGVIGLVVGIAWMNRVVKIEV